MASAGPIEPQLATELGFTGPAGLPWALICLGWVEAGRGREQDSRRHVAAAFDAFDPPGASTVVYPTRFSAFWQWVWAAPVRPSNDSSRCPAGATESA